MKFYATLACVALLSPALVLSGCSKKKGVEGGASPASEPAAPPASDTETGMPEPDPGVTIPDSQDTEEKSDKNPKRLNNQTPDLSGPDDETRGHEGEGEAPGDDDDDDSQSEEELPTD